MTEVEELEARISNLPRQEVARLREWFLEFDQGLWDEQIAEDFKAGKFKGLIEEARGNSAEGEAHDKFTG